jgi:HEAT repeat protein
VESLGRRDSTSERLLRIARENGPEELQREAVETLGRHGDARTEKLLLEIARMHPNVQVQRQAVESLGRLDDGSGGDVMADLASIARSHPSGEVRRQAVESMTRRDPDRALRYWRRSSSSRSSAPWIAPRKVLERSQRKACNGRSGEEVHPA